MKPATIFLISVLCGVSTAAAQGPEAADRVGTHNVVTGNLSRPTFGHVQPSPGPYDRSDAGSGLGLSPEPIEYFGVQLGVRRGLLPVPMKLEYCEEALANDALNAKQCPGTLLLSRTVKSGMNEEKAHDIPDNSWFDSRKRYVLIWRNDINQLAVGYSSAVMFKRRPPKTP